MAPHSTPTEPQVYVGLDYHQRTIQVCVVERGGEILLNKVIANDWREVAAAASCCGQVRRAALEACNGAAALADELVERAGWTVELAHPGYVARLKGSPDKTDFSDAQLLADLTRVGYLPRVWLAPLWVRELRRLVRYRHQQVEARRHEKVRLRGLLRDNRLASPKELRAWTKDWLQWLREEAMPQLPEASRWIVEQHLMKMAWLGEQIQAVETELQRYTADDVLTAKLLTESCVGPVTAWVLRAEIGRFDRFNNGKSLARFCGLSPRNASSGERQADAGLIKAGSGLLRATLIELAHRLGRCEERWRQMRLAMQQRGKPGSVIAAAIANRWVRGLHPRMIEPTDQGVGEYTGSAPDPR